MEASWLKPFGHCALIASVNSSDVAGSLCRSFRTMLTILDLSVRTSCRRYTYVCPPRHLLPLADSCHQSLPASGGAVAHVSEASGPLFCSRCFRTQVTVYVRGTAAQRAAGRFLQRWSQTQLSLNPSLSPSTCPLLPGCISLLR